MGVGEGVGVLSHNHDLQTGAVPSRPSLLPSPATHVPSRVHEGRSGHGSNHRGDFPTLRIDSSLWRRCCCLFEIVTVTWSVIKILVGWDGMGWTW